MLLEVTFMIKKGPKSISSSKKRALKVKRISYDEHFTRATESIDLAKSIKFVDIGDGITKKKDDLLSRI
jgi:hypothetical protein